MHRNRHGRSGVQFSAGPIRHSVTNASQSLRVFFGAVSPRRKVAEVDPATRCTLRRNNASQMAWFPKKTQQIFFTCLSDELDFYTKETYNWSKLFSNFQLRKFLLHGSAWRRFQHQKNCNRMWLIHLVELNRIMLPLRCKIWKKNWKILGKIFLFSFKLADWNGDFWPNFNPSV